MRKIKILILVIGVLLAGESLAQKEKKQKPKLSKAEMLVTKSQESELSQEEMIEAKTNVDLAVDYEKTKDKARTWYLRGMVYKLIYTSSTDFEGVSKEDALVTAGESFSKSTELDGEAGLYGIKANAELEGLWGGLLNEGVGYYNEGDMEGAIRAFEGCSLVKPNDTTGYLYAASAATELQDYETSEKNYKKLVKIQPTEANYSALISVQKDGLKNLESAMATIEEAKGVLGQDNSTVGKYEIDILIQTKKVQEAIDKINQAIESEPENSILVLKKALLYDQLAGAERKKDEPDNELLEKYANEAQAAYKKTTELDPNNVTAYFNYAISYNDKANKLYNELNLMSPKEYNRNEKKYKQDALVFLEKAVPLMEKAYELAPEDADVLFALENFYTRMNKKDKLAEITAKLKELDLIED